MSPSKPFILFFNAIRHAQPIYAKLQDVAHTGVITSESRTEFFHALQTKYKNIFAIYCTSASGATHASIIRDIFTEIATTCPAAIACIVINQPGQLHRPHRCRDPATGWGPPARAAVRRDSPRRGAFAGQALDTDPTRPRVLVVGGHSGATFVPLYSQAQPPIYAEEAILAGLVHRVQFGGDETVTSKQGAGSATTCMAYAGFQFVKAVLAGLRWEDVTGEAFVCLPGIKGGRETAEELGVEYFAVRTILGPEGASRVLRLVISMGSD
ncbi:LDH C-terminal domain-like protein [Aspergillus brunneoviolaceus CBS 621.78]|uniref:LDH C-terminal domain-like protein n=1 Tax=Aspergillus brunneoviolaceus CBS 621.78 TaxID=1450534 RepID=A0ACD1GQ59_9EURO|nr:LDH C-terminal domain-like protein [Aspergillus brunneoviolaceus CBS 621.78]RAH51258.1 LDH C-terminal domain-like protein [Aspergillus brunneoviolaceus CBS 621.78]